jgi:hypothetical protein
MPSGNPGLKELFHRSRLKTSRCVNLRTEDPSADSTITAEFRCTTTRSTPTWPSDEPRDPEPILWGPILRISFGRNLRMKIKKGQIKEWILVDLFAVEIHEVWP